MTRQAPRIDRRLLRALPRLDDPRLPIAETCRVAGGLAEELGLPRPSYQQIRLYVHSVRRRRRAQQAAEGLLLDVWLRRRPPEALLDLPDLLADARAAYDEGK